MPQALEEETRTLGRTLDPLTDLEDKVLTGEIPGLDRLRLVPVPLVPEIRLYLADDAIVWWARMEAEAGTKLVAPFWASAWVGGQALARYILDNPEVADGRRVLDLASGSGLAAIAAGIAGAASVTANDIDPYAIAAVALNARRNGVYVHGSLGDILHEDGGDADLVLAGDVLYSSSMAELVLPFLRRVVARGGEVLIGDPGRGHLPDDGVKVLATYPTTTTSAFSDAQIEEVHVLSLL
ncbi:MAG TPA: protein methyltransferase [Micromonosporaceae bacterium]|nr:protein methyltransferase [Micromonosporaceae bacterium]HCU51124.1 protein methyltransferase [Micromonosporaceae bacterium]